MNPDRHQIFTKTVCWALLCWGTALLLGIGWITPALFDPDRSSLVFTGKTPDSALYTLFIQRASFGFCDGDSFLWEHRHDPSSGFSFFHFWPFIYGMINGIGGHLPLLAVSIFLSGLWFYSLFSFCLRLGQPKSYAFFIAGTQTFFVVTFAYQLNGFRTHFEAYTFWATEHVRLYPTVTAMAFYNLAALSILWAFDSPRVWRMVTAGALVALTAYGRPFDWLVLIGALATLVVFACVMRDSKLGWFAIITLLLSMLFSSGFIFDFLTYQKLHHEAYFEQLTRGNLEVRLPSHYVKYAILCGVMLGAMLGAYGKQLFAPCQDPQVSNRSRAPMPLVWLCSLASASLLVHFKTALEGGVTIGGYGYLLVFSIAPWFFMLTAHFVWSRFSLAHARFFDSPRWIPAFCVLFAVQQIGIGLKWFSTSDDLEVRRGRYEVYRWIKKSGVKNPVVMTLGSGLEASTSANAWVFFSNPVVASYVCSADNKELLERFMLTKLLLTGTVSDLGPLFSPHGLDDIRTWTASRNSEARFWLNLLAQTLGANTFMIHPTKHRGEIRMRKIELPPSLKTKADLVAYFQPGLQTVYQQGCDLERRSSPTAILQILQGKYRLDYVYIPAFALPWARNIETNFPKWQRIRADVPFDGELWKVIL